MPAQPVLGRPSADPGERVREAGVIHSEAVLLAIGIGWDGRRSILERLNEEIKRRTHVVRLFPNAASCLRLVRALAVEMHENGLEAHRYLNMDDLREHKKEALRMAA